MSKTIFASLILFQKSFRVVVSLTKKLCGKFGEEIENALFCTLYVSLNSHATIFIHFLSAFGFFENSSFSLCSIFKCYLLATRTTFSYKKLFSFFKLKGSFMCIFLFNVLFDFFSMYFKYCTKYRFGLCN